MNTGIRKQEKLIYRGTKDTKGTVKLINLK